MASITVTYNTTMEDDGEEATVTFSKEGINTVEDLSHALGRSVVAMGFTYIHGICLYSDERTWETSF